MFTVEGEALTEDASASSFLPVVVAELALLLVWTELWPPPIFFFSQPPIFDGSLRRRGAVCCSLVVACETSVALLLGAGGADDIRALLVWLFEGLLESPELASLARGRAGRALAKAAASACLSPSDSLHKAGLRCSGDAVGGDEKLDAMPVWKVGLTGEAPPLRAVEPLAAGYPQAIV
jgi:hypothetical protein